MSAAGALLQSRGLSSVPRSARVNTARLQPRAVTLTQPLASIKPTQRSLRRGWASICAGADASSETQVKEEARLVQETESVATTRYKVKLGKPLGMVLEETAAGNIYVAELVPEGAADKSGVIAEGDRLISTSGYVYTTSQEYNEINVKGGEQLITMNVKGESFKTVMAAIASHPGNFKVTLELERGPSSSMSE